MMEGSVGHRPMNQTTTWEFIVAYCKATMQRRLNPDGTLNDVDISQGWMGAHYDLAKGGQQLLEICFHLCGKRLVQRFKNGMWFALFS